MADYWKSNPKKFCEICKIWIADNKISVERHEQGMRHKGAVQQRLRDSETKAREKEEKDAELAHTLVLMEQAAHNAMVKDIDRRRDPAISDQRVAREALWREEKVKEQERIRQSIAEKAYGGGQGSSRGAWQPPTGEDPRETEYRNWLEAKKKAEREAEEEQIRRICEQKASHYSAKQEVIDAERLKRLEAKQSEPKAPSNPPKYYGVDRKRFAAEPEPAFEPAETGPTEGEKEVYAAPEIGNWVPVAAKKDQGETETPVSASNEGHDESVSMSQEACWKEEADHLEARLYNPNEFSFGEKRMEPSGSTTGKKKAAKTVEFKKRKLPAKGNLRPRVE